MQHKLSGNALCPVLRSLECVGERWSMLILRDALQGLTRFDQFQRSLGVAPNMLARRLASLVESGMLERRRYSDRPPRNEYLLTAKGRDFLPVLVAMVAWANRHLAREGIAATFVDGGTGIPVDPVLAERTTGRPISLDDLRFAAGPAADEAVRRRMAYAERKRVRHDG